ncbi:hypothetical protein [Catellatospora bangladeshensis]
MIDLRLLREDPDTVRASQRLRGDSVDAVDDLLRADESRRSAVASFEALRAEQKQLGKLMPKAAGDEKAALLARTKDLSAAVKAAEAAVNEAETALRNAQFAIANVVQEGAPGGGEDDYVVLREVGERPALDSPRDHLELGERLGAIDTERGAKVSGARFYYLTGVGALLQLGLLQMGLWQAVEAGFTRSSRRCWSSRSRWRAPVSWARTRPRSTTCPPTTSTWSARARCRSRRTTRTRS